MGARRFHTVSDRLSAQRRLAEIAPWRWRIAFSRPILPQYNPTRHRPLLGLDPVPRTGSGTISSAPRRPAAFVRTTPCGVAGTALSASRCGPSHGLGDASVEGGPADHTPVSSVWLVRARVQARDGGCGHAEDGSSVAPASTVGAKSTGGSGYHITRRCLR